MNQNLLQRHDSQQIEAAPHDGLTQTEINTYKNFKLGIALALSMSIFLYVAEKIFCS